MLGPTTACLLLFHPAAIISSWCKVKAVARATAAVAAPVTAAAVAAAAHPSSGSSLAPLPGS